MICAWLIYDSPSCLKLKLSPCERQVLMPGSSAVAVATPDYKFFEMSPERALAIQADHPAKQWHCHHYGCGKGGNLVSLCDLMKEGASAGGKPRGDRFKDIAKDLLAMVEGGSSGQAPSPAPVAPPPVPKVNVPLKESDNERARGLTDLDKKFLVEVADMNPKASAYIPVHLSGRVPGAI
jgi:hypothetical protein